MKTTINLASQSRRTSTKVVRIVFLYSTLLFAAIFVFTLAVLSYLLILKAQFSSLDKDGNALTKQIAALAEREAKVVTLKERLASAEKILKTRSDVGSKTLSILSVIPSDIAIDSIDASDLGLNIKLSASNLFLANSVIEIGIRELVKNKPLGISKVDISSFKRDTKSASYGLSFQFFFGGKTNPAAK